MTLSRYRIKYWLSTKYSKLDYSFRRHHCSYISFGVLIYFLIFTIIRICGLDDFSMVQMKSILIEGVVGYFALMIPFWLFEFWMWCKGDSLF